MMTLEINKPRHDRQETQSGRADRANWSSCASSPSCSDGGASSRPSVLACRVGRRCLSRVRTACNCTRLPAHAVGSSAAWWRRISHGTGISPRFAEPFVPASGDDTGAARGTL